MDTDTPTDDVNSTVFTADHPTCIDVDLHVPVKIEPEDEETGEGGEGGDDAEFVALNDQEGRICEISTTEGCLLNDNLLDEQQDQNITLVDPDEIEVPINSPLISMTTAGFPSTSLQESVLLYQTPPDKPPPPNFSNKKQFTSEMEQSIQDIVNECISVLQKDPREYHPFYLRVYKYTTIGRQLGFIKLQKEVHSLWKKYDDFAVFQFRKWEGNKDEFYFNSEHSPYLTYVLTRKVIVQGKLVCRKGNQKERNMTFRRVNTLVRKLRREWREAGGSLEGIRDNLKQRLEFFEKVKHITFPGDTVTMNKYWSCLIKGFPCGGGAGRKKEEIEEKIPLKRSKRERRVPARFLEEEVEEEDEKGKVKEKCAKVEENSPTQPEMVEKLPSPRRRGLETQGHNEVVHKVKKRGNEGMGNMSVEEKREFRRHWAKTYRKDMTIEEAEEVKKYHREKYYAKLASMTEEEKEDWKAKRRFYEMQRRLKMQEMSEEEKERRRTINYVKKQAYLASKPKEWLEEKVEKRKKKTKEKVEAMTEEQKEERRRKHRDYVKSLTGEKLIRYKESMKKGLRKYLSRLKRENPQEYWNKTTGNLRKRWTEWLKYQRERTQQESPEEREARLLRYRVNQGKRRERKKLEQQGASEEEILKRLKFVEEFIRNQPRPANLSVYKPRTGARKPHNVANPRLRPQNWDKIENVCMATSTVTSKSYTGKKRGRPKKIKEAGIEPPPPPPKIDTDLDATADATTISHLVPTVTVLTPFRQVTLPQQQQLSVVQPTRITFTLVASQPAQSQPLQNPFEDNVLDHYTQSSSPLSCNDDGDSYNYQDQQHTTLFVNPSSSSLGESQKYCFVEVTSIPSTLITHSPAIFVTNATVPQTFQLSDMVFPASIPISALQQQQSTVPTITTAPTLTLTPAITTVPISTSADNAEVELEIPVNTEDILKRDPLSEEPEDVILITEQKPCPPSRQAGICDECGKSFTTNFSLQLHKHIAHPADPSILICPKCQISCTSTVTLWNHFADNHLQDVEAFPEELFPNKRAPHPKREKSEPYQQKRFDPSIPNHCIHCGKNFVQKCTLDDHIRRVHEGKGHFCDVCGRDQQSAAKLWRHKVERHNLTDLPPPEGVPAVNCKYCGEIVMRGYEQHVKKRHPDQLSDFQEWYVPELGTAPKQHAPVTKVKCPQCPSIVSSKLLNRHIKQIHTDRPRHPCPECGFPFKRMDHMKKHYRDQHAVADIEKRLEAKQLIKIVNEKHFKATCLLCSVDLAARPTVRAHFVQAHHEIFLECQVASLPIFECQICQEKFSKEGQLKSHMESLHGDKLHPCQHCGIWKYSEAELKKHENGHKKNEMAKKRKLGICHICEYDARANLIKEGGIVSTADLPLLLRKHVKYEHPQQFIPCPNQNCLRYGTNAGEFQNHLSKCKVNGVLKCKQFAQETVGMLWVYCPECLVSIRLYLKDKHLMKVHNIEKKKKKFICGKCVGRVFVNEKFYVAHMHQIHQVPFEELLDLAPERKTKLKTGSGGRKRRIRVRTTRSIKKEDVSNDEDGENNSQDSSKKRVRRAKELERISRKRGRKPKFKNKWDDVQYQFERKKKLVICVEKMSDDLTNFYLARQIVIKIEPET